MTDRPHSSTASSGSPPGGAPEQKEAPVAAGATSRPMPHRPGRRSPRLFPILFGLFLLLGFAFFSLLMLIGSFLGFGVFAGSRGGSGFMSGSRPIALIKIDRAIMPGPYFDFWMDTLQEIAEDDSIQGVIVRIDSPGGSVASSQELYDSIIDLRESHGKRVYVSMGDMAASGGYYIAAAADRVFANRGTLTGSVGVISTVYRIEGLAEKAGIEIETIKTGRFKDAGSMFREMNEQDRKMFNLLLDDAYEQFIEDILKEREEELAEALAEFPDADWEKYLFEKPEMLTPRNFLLQIADGRLYSGEQALGLGLVDELGSLQRVKRRLADDLGIRGRMRVYEPRRNLSFLDLMTMKVRAAVPTSLSYPTLQYRLVTF